MSALSYSSLVWSHLVSFIIILYGNSEPPDESIRLFIPPRKEDPVPLPATEANKASRSQRLSRYSAAVWRHKARMCLSCALKDRGAMSLPASRDSVYTELVKKHIESTSSNDS